MRKYAALAIVSHWRRGVTRLHRVPDNDEFEVIRDEEGLPYISADGLEDWALYVATDESGMAFQYGRPQRTGAPGQGEWEQPFKEASRAHAHLGEWEQSLYRVWRVV